MGLSSDMQAQDFCKSLHNPIASTRHAIDRRQQVPTPRTHFDTYTSHHQPAVRRFAQMLTLVRALEHASAVRRPGNRKPSSLRASEHKLRQKTRQRHKLRSVSSKQALTAAAQHNAKPQVQSLVGASHNTSNALHTVGCNAPTRTVFL